MCSVIVLVFERVSLSSNAGCKVEPFFLNVEAVNTHRERPVVGLHRNTPVAFDLYESLKVTTLSGVREVIDPPKCGSCVSLLQSPEGGDITRFLKNLY